MVVACTRTTAAEIESRAKVRKEVVRGEDRERPYLVESWVVGARACLPSARNARSKDVGVLVGLDGCEVRRCDPCALVRPRVPCVSRVCPGSPRCLFTGTGIVSYIEPVASLFYRYEI